MNRREVKEAADRASAIRAAFGAIAILAPGPAARLLGFPAHEDNPTARLMGRLFGVRELALAAFVWGTPARPRRLRQAFAVNAAVDAGDAAVLAAALRSRPAPARAAAMIAPALGGCAIWLYLSNEL